MELKEDNHEDGIELMLDKNGVAHEVFKTEIYFTRKLEMRAFNSWMNAAGAKAFSEWYEGMKKLEGTNCMSCRWRDPTRQQCFDGHIQGIGDCSSWEMEPWQNYT